MSKFTDGINSIASKLRSEMKKESSSPEFNSFGGVEMAIAEVPEIIEDKKSDVVLFGVNNNYPNEISNLKYGSPIHAAIVSTAGDMISGDGFLLNGLPTKEESDVYYNNLPSAVKTNYDLFLSNENDPMSIEEIDSLISLDFKEQGAFAVEVVYNTEFTRITRVKYVDVKKLRASKKVNGKIEYWLYSNKWEDYKKNSLKTEKIYAFDPKDKKLLNQLIYVKRGSLDYYGEPDYSGSLTWIQTDNQMGIFHLSNIENGMNPSMLFEFFKVPKTEADKQRILDDIRKNYRGAKKAGKHMVMFSEGTENAAKVGPVQISNLDKQLLNLAELCDRKILTGHKLTSPLLAGISVSGQLGGNAEVEKSFVIYDKTRINPYRKKKDAVWNKILSINGVPFKVKTNPYNPFANA